MCEQPLEHAAVRAVHAVTCRLPIMLKSGGAIPRAAQSRASSDTLLLVAATLWLEWEPGASPWGAFMFAAAATEAGRRRQKQVSVAAVGWMLCWLPSRREPAKSAKPSSLAYPVSWTISFSSAARYCRQNCWLPPAWRHFLFQRRRSSASPSAPGSPSATHITAGCHATPPMSFTTTLFFFLSLSSFSHHGKGLRGKRAIWLIIGHLYSRCWWGRGLVSGDLETRDQVFKFSRGLNARTEQHEFRLIKNKNKNLQSMCGHATLSVASADV